MLSEEEDAAGCPSGMQTSISELYVVAADVDGILRNSNIIFDSLTRSSPETGVIISNKSSFLSDERSDFNCGEFDPSRRFRLDWIASFPFALDFKSCHVC